MKTGRAGRILCAGLLVLGGTAAVLWACSDTGGIHGTVTESLHGHVLCGSFMGLTRTADPSYAASTNTDVNGDYKFTGLTPDGYAVSAGHMAYQPKTANVTVTAGGDVGKDFVLDPVAANIKADVVSLDQSSGGKTGGWRSVQVKITYQMMCHGPMRLVVWAWGGSPAKPYVIHDSGGTGGYDYSCWLDSTVSPNVTTSGFDTVATLRFPWNTTWVPNGSYTIKAALKCSDPQKDGVDENPDPVAESWVHWAGSPPTATTDGVAGGTTVSISVVNLVITSYRAKDTPLPSHDQDAFLYDPDAASPLCNPSFEVSIDNWATEPMVIRVWMAATAWSDTRPVPDYDPYVDLDVNAAGTYTLTWDGSNPGYPYWEGEWGTWSFDVDLYRLDATATWAIDHFYAKTHDGQSENYDVLVDPVNHHVWWYCDETTTPPGYQFRCNYIVHSDESTQPTAVDLVTLKELTVKAQDSKTGTWTYLNTLHDNIATYPGSGYTTESDTLGTWRTVFTGQTASGAEHRRDHTNPRILATNGNEFTAQVVSVVWAGVDPEDGHTNLSVDDPHVTPDPTGGVRMYPERNTPAGPLHLQVKAVATLNAPIPKGRTAVVYFKAFDMDDPTQNGANNPVDTGDTATEFNGGDNKGSPSFLPLLSYPYVPDVTLATGQVSAEVLYTIRARQPGNNWRVVAFCKEEQTNGVAIDTGPVGRGLDLKRDTILVPAANKTDLLTVWRTLHVEADSMCSPPSSGSERNAVAGKVVGVDDAGGVAVKIRVDQVLNDGSPDLDDDPNPKNGRFENGTIVIGSGTGAQSTSGLLGNGSDFVRRPAGISLPFKVTKAGLPDVTGQVTKFSSADKTFGLSVWVPTSYEGGTIAVCGVTMTNLHAYASQEVTVTNLADIPFVLTDDDAATLPKAPPLDYMAPKLSPAFVTPVLDATNSNDSVPFDLNLEYEEYGPPAGGRPDAFASAGDRDPGYWIAYVMMAYQPKPTRDRDPDNEGIHTLGTCFQASYAYVFCETVRDSRPSNEPEMLKRFVVHEALHQFAIPDDLVPGVTGGLYDYDAVLNAFICPDLTPDNIERIRGNQDGPL